MPTTSDPPDRLFLGVPLPDEARGAIEAHLREALGASGIPGRAVPPRNWHLTLRFLGSTAAEPRRRIVEELRGAALGDPFTLRFGGMGAFPRPRRASVLWIGVEEGRERLDELAGAAEAAARRAGFAAEEKPFRAHLTLSRLNPPADVAALVEAVPPARTSLPVAEVVLFRSHLGGGPARYEVVERFPLGGAGTKLSVPPGSKAERSNRGTGGAR